MIPRGICHDDPVAPSTFVGRERECTELGRLLSDYPIVTLVGPGGIGKTRLATEVTTRFEDRYDGGTLLAELSGTSDEDDIASIVARQLGFDSIEALRYRCAGSTTLVVLDNCESALKQISDVAQELADGDEAVRVLATSRAPLQVMGERVVNVEGLELPSGNGSQTTEAVASTAAARLFLDLAAAAGAGWSHTEENLRGVAQLVRQLDGLPLAIQLAAARSRVLSPPELVKLLDKQLDLLTRPGDDGDRHHSLRSAIAASYEPLADRLKSGFRRLSVLRGPFDLQLAHSLMGESGMEIDTLDLLTELVDASLVAVRANDNGRTDYRLFDSIRAFGLEQMGDAEVAEASDAFVDAMVGFADSIVAKALEAFTPEVLGRIREQFGHLADAIAWCVDNDETPARAYRLFIPFYGPTGARSEVAQLARRVRGRWTTSAPLEAEAWAVMGNATFLAGETTLGISYSQEAAAHPEATALAKMISHRSMGFAAIQDGRVDEAKEHLQTAIDLAIPFSAAFARELRISLAAVTRDPDETAAAIETLAAIAAESAMNDEKVNVLWASIAAATHQASRGDMMAARRAADGAMAVADRTGFPWSIGAAHRAMGGVLAVQSGWAEAAPHFRAAVEQTLAIGDIEGIAVSLRAAAGAARFVGDHDLARALWNAVPPVRAKSITLSIVDREERELMDEHGPPAPMDVGSSVAQARRLLGEATTGPPSQEAGGPPSKIIRFGRCEVNLDMQELRRDGERVHIEPQVYEVLVHLIENRGKVVAKHELLDEVWGDRFVSESALSSRIMAARKATGDDGRTQGVIRTVHGKGFSFVAAVDD